MTMRRRSTRWVPGCAALLATVTTGTPTATATEHGVVGDCGWVAYGPVEGGWSVALHGNARDASQEVATATSVLCELLAFDGAKLVSMGQELPGEASAIASVFYITLEPSEYVVCWTGNTEYLDEHVAEQRRCSQARFRAYGWTARRPVIG